MLLKSALWRPCAQVGVFIVCEGYRNDFHEPVCTQYSIYHRSIDMNEPHRHIPAFYCVFTFFQISNGSDTGAAEREL